VEILPADRHGDGSKSRGSSASLFFFDDDGNKTVLKFKFSRQNELACKSIIVSQIDLVQRLYMNEEQ